MSPRRKPAPKRRPARGQGAPRGRTVEVGAAFEGTVARLGAHGDGIIETPEGPCFVTGALPGERVRGVRTGDRLDAADILDGAPERVTPPCAHAAACGGCTLQHMAQGAQAEWKRGLVQQALAHRGLERVPIAPTLTVAPASRRRVTLTFEARSGQRASIGFQARRSHALVPVERCHILAPELAAAWDGLAVLAGVAARLTRRGQIHVLVTEGGPDIDLRLQGPAPNRPVPDLEDTQALLAAAETLSAARLSVDGERLAEWRRPEVRLGDVPVSAPPGAFFQASADGQAHLTALVREAVPERVAVADLFAGCGTFALALAADRAVHAVESDGAALEALTGAVRRASGLKPVTTERRDLHQRPLTPKELAAYGAVVFDPPRAGAQAQASALTASPVRHVAAVSCNPATLARDLRLLVDGGYEVASVHPVDQFVWSAHVECVAFVNRP